jgi:hypothetical protein
MGLKAARFEKKIALDTPERLTYPSATLILASISAVALQRQSAQLANPCPSV